jgi:hypothetical protein
MLFLSLSSILAKPKEQKYRIILPFCFYQLDGSNSCKQPYEVLGEETYKSKYCIGNNTDSESQLY